MIRLLLKTIWLVFVMTFILAGCSQEQKQDTLDALACGPDVETLGVVPDYAAQAIEAAGGLDAWTKTKGLELDCVVTFYQPDDSFYLTEQHYEVYPWSKSIRISAVEPQGKFLWQLSKGQFNVLEGGEQFDGLPVTVGSRCLAELVLNVITAPARLLDKSVESARAPEPVKIQGQWYYPIERRVKPALEAAPDLSDAVFYQNRDTLLPDMLWFATMSGERSLRVRGYDYVDVEKGGILAPTKIEIFSTDAGGNSQKRLVKIDCHTLRRTK